MAAGPDRMAAEASDTIWWGGGGGHTEFSVRLDEMMIIFILEFINSDCTILSGLVSHFQKGITLGCLLLI